jgi:hypothetical protein
VEHEQESKPKAEPTYRCLFPEVVKAQDLLTVLRALLRFVRMHHYWPKRIDLVRAHGFDKSALVDLLSVHVHAGNVATIKMRSGGQRYGLASRGFSLLAVEPFEAKRRPPSKAVLTRLANKAAARIQSGNPEEANYA